MISHFFDHFTTTDGCWLWTGHLMWKGYGMYSGKRAHRIMWYLHHGPTNLEIHHTCGIRNCVNIDHLQALTMMEHKAIHQPTTGRTAGPTTPQWEDTCRNGHPRTEANTYIRPNGWRDCRICKGQMRP